VRRSLSREEAALWARVAGTVKPIAGRPNPPPAKELAVPGREAGKSILRPIREKPGLPMAAPAPPRRAPQDLRKRPHTLDANWDRKLAHGLVAPDFTIDLHGHTLDAAHARLEFGLGQALAQGARLVLLITGRARPSDGHDGRGERRGAIRAKFLDWLAIGSHSSQIAAIRPAHPRHGGAGAVYLILRRPTRGG
jgi:DNA-nicking Smr family endonuclease